MASKLTSFCGTISDNNNAKPSPDTYLNDLNAGVFMEVAKILDSNQTWKRLISLMPGSPFSAQDVQEYEKELVKPSGSPATPLLIDMGHRGYQVSHLIYLLEKLQLERALVPIKPFQSVSLSKKMQTEYVIQGGFNSSLEIECTAIGFPRPTYQWFKLNTDPNREEWVELLDQCYRTLHIKSVVLEDSGKYCCRFSNFDQCTNKRSCDFTDVISVIVEHDVFDTGEFETGLPQMRTPLEILREPSCPSRGPFYQGSKMALECIAVGREPISYEWFKNGHKITGEDGPTLNFIVQPEDDLVRFKYQCRVYNAFASVQSDVVTIKLAPPRDSPVQYLAEDKVALVIANDEYKEHSGLRSAVTDAITVAQQLKKLDFKILTAINLEEDDMRRIVGEFCKLLDSGVYGVFYYAGHGFEVNRQCYMMPVDADAEYCCAQCICVEDVKAQMQSRNPALCCLLIDMCRKSPDSNSIDVGRGYQLYETRIDRNVICAYATSYSCPALDGPEGKNGLFVKHLRNHITKNLPIEAVLNHVIEDVSADPAASNTQFPSIGEKTLAQTRRSLADRIHAMLSSNDQRTDHYLSLIRKPNNFMIRCESLDERVLHVHVTFDMEEQVICNTLVIKILVTDENDKRVASFASYLGNVKPAYMCENVEQRLIEGENYFVITLRNLQKLKEPLYIQGNVFHNQQTISVWPEKCLEYPLLANVSRHWQVVKSYSATANLLATEDDGESGIGSSFYSPSAN